MDTYVIWERFAVLVKDNIILVQRDKDGNEYALPGGHVKSGETLEDGLIRETQEEMSVKIEWKRMLWSEECGFDILLENAEAECYDKHSVFFYEKFYMLNPCFYLYSLWMRVIIQLHFGLRKNPEFLFIDPRPWVKRKPSPDFDWGIVMKESKKVVGMIAVFDIQNARMGDIGYRACRV